MSQAEADSGIVDSQAAAEAAGPARETATVGGAETWMEDFQQTMKESRDSAIRSARFFQHNSPSHLRTLQDFVPHAMAQYKTYEDVFVNKVKEGLMTAKENPAAAIGMTVGTGLVLMRGPRRFLLRHTLGRFQSEEAQFLRAEKNVKELGLSVDLIKNESKKLLERASLAERDMNRGHSELMIAGSEIQRLARSVYKVENQATDLVDGLRQIPGREALKLRAEVASMASHLRQKRVALNKRIMKISELGVPV